MKQILFILLVYRTYIKTKCQATFLNRRTTIGMTYNHVLIQ